MHHVYCPQKSLRISKQIQTGKSLEVRSPYLLAKLEMSVSRQENISISQYELSSVLTTIKDIKNTICPITYFSNNLTTVSYMRSLK